jgi:hypothetical protein
MRESLKPWQVMPAKIIKMALEHADKETDFDHQISFLLLDIGVENALKTYLVNKKQDVEKLYFDELLRKVKEELVNDKKEIPLDEVSYFHKVRNRLYHQGDGVRPTDENLKRYSDLAQKLLKILINVDITKIETKPESKYIVWDEDWNSNRTFEEVIPELYERLKYFHDSCAVLTELIKPKYATRKFALKIQEIMEDNQTMVREDSEIDDAKEIIDKASERLRLFNQLVQKPIENLEFADYLLKDINHIYVLKSFQGLGDDINENWEKYENVYETIQGLPTT